MTSTSTAAPVARTTLGGGALTVLVATFLPWVSTGTRRRNSYGLFGLIERLEFTPGGMIGWLIRLWPLVPLLAVATTTAAWWPRPRLSGGLGVLLGCYAGGVALAIGRAPVDTHAGRWVTMIAAAVALLASVATLAADVRPTRRAG